jgi:oligoendopeptidase F
MFNRNSSLQILFIILLTSAFNFGQDLERKDVDPKYKWNLEDLYKTEDDWKADKEKITSQIQNVTKYQGKLGKSANDLYSGLKDYYDLLKVFFKFSSYASQKKDEDLRNSDNQASSQIASSLGSELFQKTSFINPEILKIDPKTLKKFFNQKKELAEYKMFISDIQRLRDHTLSANEEKILASFSLTAETPSNVYGIFNNAEMPFAEVTLSNNENVKLTPSSYTRYRSVENREDRKKIFESFFSNYGKFQNTLGANYAGKIQNDFTFAKNKKFSSALEYALSASNIPTSVYENLINQIHKSLPTLHRFLELKKKMLGVDTLHYYDLYTPLVKKLDKSYTIEEGQKLILAALNPLGEDYLKTLNTAFNNRWIDYYPTTGKRSGAYSSGSVYDVHPYILTNWNDDYESLSTLAHELGHTMHSYYSNKTQPFVDANYSIFVAEIASTVNETLLNNHLVQNANSNEEKLSILGSYLDLLRTTIFRQTLFAEFELEMHNMIERDEPLTGEIISNAYYELVKKYYGHNEGVCKVDPYIAYEWAYIPHFINYNYYVYQYSTSLIYATAIAQRIFDEGSPAVNDYDNLLKGGSSKYPIDLIKDTGIDPLSQQPFELTIKRMNNVMDEIEKLLK